MSTDTAMEWRDRQEEGSDMPAGEKGSRQPGATTLNTIALAIVLAIYTFFGAWVYARTIPVGNPPDEAAHISYLQDVSAGDLPLPDYRTGTILSSTRPNYLNHPPLYYTASGMIGKYFHWDPWKDFMRFRLLSALMVGLGVMLWVLTARAMGSTRLRAVAVVAATLAIPMFLYLAGSVNNDNLAYLAVALFANGVVQLDGLRKAPFYLCAMGLAAAFLTKATAALFLLSFALAWLALIPAAHRKRLLMHRHFYLAAAVLVAVCSLYYVPTLIAYGTPFPRAGDAWAGHPPPLHPMGVAQYSVTFAKAMIKGLPLVLSHQSLFPLRGWLATVLYLMCLAPVALWIVARPVADRCASRYLADAFVLALLVTIIGNVATGRIGYLNHGVLGGTQPRYYAYTLPGLFLFLPGVSTGPRLCAFYTFFLSCTAAVLLAVAAPFSIVSALQAPAATVLQYPGTSRSDLTSAGDRGPQGAGYVDRLSRRGNALQLSGWAVNAADRSTAALVWVFAGERVLGTVKPGRNRPDVERAMKSAAAADAGFALVIENVPQDLDVCLISLAAEQDDGSLVPLARGDVYRNRCPSASGDGGVGQHR